MACRLLTYMDFRSDWAVASLLIPMMPTATMSMDTPRNPTRSFPAVFMLRKAESGPRLVWLSLTMYPYMSVGARGRHVAAPCPRSHRRVRW
jgi:hypothetical protein